jgi:chromosome partitioning protein
MIYGKRHIKNTLTKIFETGDLVCADENLDRINTLQDDMVKKSSILKNRFNSSMDFLKKYDFILLDCAPEFGVLTLNALFAANECLLVTNVDIFCFQAINSFQKRFMEIRKFNPTIKFNGIAVNRFCYYEKIQKEMMEKLRDEFKEELYNQDIRKSVEIIKAQAEGRTVFEGGKTNVSIDFKIFCEEFILRTQFVF